MGELVEEFWVAAQQASPFLANFCLPAAWAFGDSAEMANELAALVVRGAKTATASRYADYLAEDEPLPEVGQHSIILDGSHKPVALIEITAVDVLPFNQVSADHAQLEGEGDCSLEYWRASHRAFWSSYGSQFDEQMLIVTEQFRVLYSALENL